MTTIASCVAAIAVGVLAAGGPALASHNPVGTDVDRGDAPPLTVGPPSAVEIAALPSLEFSSAVVPVLESFPNDYAFFYFDRDMHPVIGFTHKAVPTVIAAVDSTGQQAQIIEDAGFTDAEYTAAAEELVVELLATWPEEVPFPMIGARPDLGVGVIGAIRIAEMGSSDASQSLHGSTRLLQEAEIEFESPFSLQIDAERVFGPGTAA